MIQVQSLRLRGLVASSLLALAACSGTANDGVDSFDDITAGQGGTAMTRGGDARPLGMLSRNPQGQPGGQDPGAQDPRSGDRGALVQRAVENAQRSLELRLFEDARNEAAFALELEPNNAVARDILARCQQVLGESTGNAMAGVVDEAIILDRIRRERERALVEQELQVGRAHQAAGEYGRAIDSFERAATMMRFSTTAAPNDALRLEAEKLLTGAQEQRRTAEQQALDNAKTKSEAELARIERDQAIARETKVESLLEAANVKFQSGDYAKSLNLVEQAQVLDPTNPTAQSLRDLADRARHSAMVDLHRERFRTEWDRTFRDLQQSTVPQVETVEFDPARWAEVSRRKPASFTALSEAESPENQAIYKILSERVMEHSFASATVQDWSSYYAQLTGVTFFVAGEVKEMAAETTTLTDFRLSSRSVVDALKAIQTQTGVAWKITDGMVQLVTPANAIGTLITQQFKITDLTTAVQSRPGPNLRLANPGDDAPTFPEQEEETQPAVVDEGRLTDLIKTSIATDKWDQVFTISGVGGQLYVRADRETLAEVERLINELRRHVGIQIDVESRFLKVEDSFLEDVGIDLRGLGNQSSQGVAGRGLEKAGNRQNAGFDDFGPRVQQNTAVPGVVGTGTSPGVFFNDGNDGDVMARVEGLYNQTLGGRNGGLTNAGGLSLQYAFLDDTEVEVVLRAVSKQERSEQIEAPRLLVYNNVRAHMLYLRSLSYIRDFEVEIAQAAAVANPVIGVVQDGVVLDVRPVVDSDLKFITMEVRPTVMAVQTPIPTFTTTLGIGQPISIQLPEVTRQTVRTTLTMPDGGTIMLGGMRLVERQNLRSTVPLLGSLPGLSWLFSRNGTSVQNRKILILIRAKIVVMEEMEPAAAMLPEATMAAMR
jgi:tetratricopeptide (TPR) repeat protein